MRPSFSKQNLFLFAVCAAVIVFSVSAYAQTSTSTPTDTKALIEQLRQTIASLQAEINELKAQISSSRKEIEQVRTEIGELKLTRTLSRGSQGDDVKQLQQYLVSEYPDLYPTKQITGYFGPATETAIKKLQEKHGIEAIGIVGPKTRSKLNELVTQGAGESGKVPPGLLTAPGLITSSIPATAATPASTTGTSTVSAEPAVPATPAQPATPSVTSSQSTTTPTASSSSQTSEVTSTATTPSASSSSSSSSSPSSQTSSSTSSPQATADTTAPTISSVQATASSTSATITWTSNEASDSQVEYGITAAYGSASTLAASLVTSHTVNLVSLSAGTTYYYRVKSKDAAGNLATSVGQTFATSIISSPTAVRLPAPTNLRGDWSFGWWDIRDNKLGQKILFQYSLDAGFKASKFRLYQKRPTDSSFSIAAEFSGFDTTSCTGNSAAIYSGEWYIKGPPWGSCPYWFISRDSLNASSYTVGEYSYYVDAVDAAGIEGDISPTVKFVFLQPVVITSPTASQTTSVTPTFQWTRGSDWASNFQTQAVLFDSLGAINPSWTSFFITAASKTYDGPALDPTKQYRFSVYGRSANPSQLIDSFALPAATIDFQVSTSTTIDTTLNNLASALASLVQMLQQVKQLLR